MRKTLMVAALLACASIVSASAQTLTPAQTGTTIGPLNFNGIIEGHVQPGLSAQMSYTLESVNFATNTWVFDYTLTNTSTAPVTASAVSGFGFNTNPDVVAAAIVSGSAFQTALTDVNVSGGFGKVDFCASTGPTCNGGASNGIDKGLSTSGSFSLDFAGVATAATQLSLSDFFVRYQEIGGSQYGSSGIGIPVGVNPVPGPIVGAGLPGLIAGAMLLIGLNRRRKQRLA